MTLASRVASRLLRLPPATNRVAVERDIKIAMPDGVVLLADHYSPLGTNRRPTVLVRSPYGRAGFYGLMLGRIIAERGYHVLVQSCRGTFGSGGEFTPVRQESADGRATIDWIARQDWFDGRLGTMGASYLGFTQWAVASDPPVPIRSMAITVSASRTHDRVYRGGSFSLADNLGWTYLIANQERSRLASLTTILTAQRRLGPLWNRLPLGDLDRQATGKTVLYYQDWLAHTEPDDPFWKATDFRSGLEASTAEFQLVGGWYDIFLPDTVADYLELRRLGRRPRLVIGPWTHVQTLNSVVIRETLEWMDRTLANGDAFDGRQPVHVQLSGSRQWLDFDDWPPPAEIQEWRLQPHGVLSREAAPESEPDRYRYDPSDPTPSLGGALLNPGTAGPKDNQALEARADVLVYTSVPLEADANVVGPVTADLFVGSSLPSTDFFARLCDVDESGRSSNVSDGLLRLRSDSAGAGVRHIRVDLWPVGHCFRRGHRLRVQVSSGAHPRFARNLGTGEPLRTATRTKAADQEIFHDPEHPSAVLLPFLR